MNHCRNAARKILQSFQSSIIDALHAKDRLNEGLISREDLQRTIESQKVHDLMPGELILLMKYSDRGNKGYIATEKFIERLQNLVTETKGETVIR